MRYLVTGGAGFIGSHIVRRLGIEPNAEVVVLDNLSVGSRQNIPSSCRLVEGDINDDDTLGRALDGVEVVLHLAAFVSIRGSFERPEADLRDNCQGMLSVFRKAGECGVRRVVFASSMGVYGEPERLPVAEEDPAAPASPYGLSKLRGEMYGKALSAKYGYSFIALRYFNTYGAGQTPSDYVGVLTAFINMALDGRPLTIYGDGEQTRDLVWVEDVAEASVLAARSEAEGTFNIGSGAEISINQVARMVQECVGASATHVAAPPGEIRRMCADISRALSLLGYNPRGALAEQLPSIVDYWRRRKTSATLARQPANA
jgi:UDP-glucose 4-epimerase